MPAIDLILKVNDEDYLDNLLLSSNSRVGKKEKVSHATFTFTTSSVTMGGNSEPSLNNFMSELGMECDLVGIPSKNFKLISYLYSGKTREGNDYEYYKHHIDGYVSGPIRPVLHIYDFAKSKGINYKSFSDIMFS